MFRHLLVASLISTFFFPSLYAKPLRINIGWDYPKASLITQHVEAIFKEANIDLKLQVLPNKRSLVNANEGIDDGDATRIWEINKFYPNLHRVPVQTFQLNIVAMTNKKIMIKTFQDLKPYNLGVVRGMKIVEVKADALQSKSLIKVSNHKTLIEMLASGRIDIAVTDKGSLITEVKKANIKGLYLFKKPLMVLPLYLQLHKKNKHLIPRLTQAAEALHKRGTFKKINDLFDQKHHNGIKHLITIIDNN